jgi:amidase
VSDDIVCRSASDLAAAIRAGELSPVTVVDAFLDRIDGDGLNAWVTVLHERARERAREAERAVQRGDDLGPLHGVPVGVKDLTPLEGAPLTFGAKPFADNVAERDAVVVERLKAAGAIPVGKTNTPEFGMRVTTNNELQGPTSTPFDRERNAGGSSGGSAAAVAAGQVPLATGSDAGGSVRIPAAFCNAVGIKPSYGRVPKSSRPNAFASHTPMSHEGAIARTVEDAAIYLDAVAGPDPRDPFSLPDDGVRFTAGLDRDPATLSIGVSYDLGTFPIDERVRAGVDRAAVGLRDAGLTVEDAAVDLGYRFDDLVAETSTPQWETAAAALAERLAASGIDLTGDHAEDFPDHVVRMARDGAEREAVEYLRADEARTRVYDGVVDVFEDHDLLLCPVTAVPPVENGAEGPEQVDGTPVDPESEWFPAFVFNLTGHPAAAVPAGLTEGGLPVGVQIVGRRHADESVVAAAAAIERERPWVDDYPWA